MTETSLKLVGIAATVLIALSGCGVSTSSDQATTSSGVALPRTKQDAGQERQAFVGYYRELLRSGVSAKVARCYRREVEKLPPDEIGALSRPTTPHMRSRAVTLNKSLSESCLPPGTALYARGVSNAELKRTRDQLENVLPVALRARGASAAQINCVKNQIHRLPPAAIKKFTTDKPTAKRIMQSAYAKCRGAK